VNSPLSRTAFAAVILALCASLLPASAAQAQSQDKYQHQARVVTNNKRADHGLAQLKKGDCVQKFARRQARKMANQDRMFHQDLGVVLNQCGLTGVAENVAAGYPTGRAAVKAWMHSAGHRANLLGPTYRMLGMAVRRSADGTPYAAQVFGRG
jgi:uncharacterized protein YkwD